MAADLQVKIGADISSYKAGMADAAAIASDTAKKLEVTNVEYQKQQKSILQLSIQLASYKNIAEQATDPSRLITYNRKIQDLEREIGKLENAGKAGFDELGNAVQKSTYSFGGAFQKLREIAYILPGVGVAGLIGFFTGPIIEYIASLDLVKKALNQVTTEQKDLNDALDGKEYQGAVKSVAELTEYVKLAKEGFISKNDVVKEYNDTLGKTMGKVSSLDGVEQMLVKNGPDYIKMTLYKAAAQVALAEAAKKAAEAEGIRQKPISSFGSIFDKMPVMNKTAADTKASQANLLAAQKEDQAKQVAEAQKGADEQFNIMNKLFEKVAAIAKEHHFKLIDPKDTEKAKDGFAIIEAEINKIKVALEDATIANKPTIMHRLSIELEDAQNRLDKLKQTYANSLLAGGGAPALSAQGTTVTGQGGLLNTGQDVAKDVANHNKLQTAIQSSIFLGREWKKELKEEAATVRELSRAVGVGLMNAFQNALSGTESFVSAMGHFLAQLIEKLIAAAAAAAILAVLLQATGFGAAIGAESSFGAIFGQLAGFSSSFGGGSSGGGGFQGFATGGIFTTPRVGMFAEAGPEAIVTPKHLAEFAGVQSGSMELSVEHRISGPDLLLTITRAQKQKGRLS